MSFIKVLILLCVKHVRFGEKTSKCSECGNVLNQSSSLTQHQRIHTREERYKCNKCGKGVHQSLNLRRHREIHTGGTPYKCKEWGKAFNQCSYLTQHQFMLERNLTNVGNLPKPLTGSQNFLDILLLGKTVQMQRI